MPISKPTTYPEWASDGGADITEPSSDKKGEGWIVEQPAHEYFNWWQNNVYNWVLYFESVAESLARMNAANWTAVAAPPGVFLLDIDFSGGQWRGVSGGGGSQVKFWSSADGLTWTSADITPAGSSSVPTGLAFSGSLALVINGPGGIYTSPDGVTWTSRTGISTSIFGCTYGNSLFVIVGNTGSGGVETSSDGITWTSRLSPSHTLRNVAYANSLFVAVGDTGTIYTSPDGVTWTSRTSGTTQNLADVAYGSGLWVAVGAAGTVITSPDGITWTARTSGTTSALGDVTHSGEVFLASGAYSILSTDGISWTFANNPALFQSSAYANGKFIATVGDGSLYSSLAKP